MGEGGTKPCVCRVGERFLFSVSTLGGRSNVARSHNDCVGVRQTERRKSEQARDGERKGSPERFFCFSPSVYLHEERGERDRAKSENGCLEYAAPLQGMEKPYHRSNRSMSPLWCRLKVRQCLGALRGDRLVKPPAAQVVRGREGEGQRPRVVCWTHVYRVKKHLGSSPRSRQTKANAQTPVRSPATCLSGLRTVLCVSISHASAYTHPWCLCRS